MLAADLLHAGVGTVVGLDIDQPVLDRARTRHEGRSIEWLQGDLLAVNLEAASFEAPSPSWVWLRTRGRTFRWSR